MNLALGIMIRTLKGPVDKFGPWDLGTLSGSVCMSLVTGTKVSLKWRTDGSV